MISPDGTNSPGPSDLTIQLDRFEQAWQERSGPDLLDFLPAYEERSADADTRRRALIELILVDLEYRWAGAAQEESAVMGPTVDQRAVVGALPMQPRLEDYVTRHSELGPLEGLPLELICGEYRVRKHFGALPTHDEFCTRFSSHGQRLLDALSDVDLECAEATAEPPLPGMIGGSEIQRKLSQGAFGADYLARDTQRQGKSFVSTNSDRNLLLGILALQMDFISREQLIAATNVWVTDKSRRLDEILLEQQALRPDTHPLLVALVDKHLELHDGDAEESLAVVSSIGSVRDELSKLGDAEIDASMMRVGTDHEPVDPYATEALSLRATSDDARFRILRPHARGGLGEVFVAQDGELNREVALKQIQHEHADNPSSRSRFVLEGEVTGGLEHPGIVPVYGLGQYADGRPYYAMRFIRGDSLEEAIDRFHGANKADSENAGFNSVAFRQLLGRFVDVCNAIQYAHSRGVLHRDLKPGNIMLGKYGETLVVDWGLAKLQGRTEANKVEGEQTLQPSSASGSAPTQFGSALGTPAYMPPEQAAGKLDALGPESDVYSLGATLYQLLTGRPPFRGDDVGQLLTKVQRGDFLAPREVKPDIPKPLEAICLRAMTTRRQDRYASPLAVADDVERFLADEPFSTYSEPLVARSRRWVRKQQTFAATTAAVVLVSTVGLAILSAVVSAKNSELTEANQRETEARTLAEENEEAARQQSELALAALTSILSDIESGLRNLPGSADIRRRLLRTSLTKLENVSTRFVEQAIVDRQTMHALRRMGDTVLRFGADDMDVPEQESAIRLAGKFYRRALEIAQQRVIDDPSDAEAQRDLSISYDSAGLLQLQYFGQTDKALASYQKSLQIREELAEENPNNPQAQRDLSISYGRVGDAQIKLGQTDLALDSYQKNLRINETLAEDDPNNAQTQRDLSISHDNVGMAQLQFGGQTDQALASFQKSLQIREKLAEDDPNNAEAQRDLSVSHDEVGDAQLQLGQSDLALASYQKSLQISEKLAEDDPDNARAQRDLAITNQAVGDVQVQLGPPDLALASYQKSLQISEKLAEDDPNNAQTQRDLSNTYQAVGDVRLQLGQSDQALVCYQKCLQIREKLAEEDPKSVQAQTNLSVTYQRVGSGQNDLERHDLALSSFKKSLQILAKLAEDDPNSTLVRHNLAVSYDRVGYVQLQLGQTDLALASYQRSLQISEKLAEDDPNSTKTHRNLSISHEGVGNVQLQMGQCDQALASYQKCLHIREKLAEDDPNSARAQRDLAVSYQLVGRAQRDLGQHDLALGSFQKSQPIYEKLVEDDPNNARAQLDLAVWHEEVGHVQLQLGQTQEALTSYQRCLQIRQELAEDDQNDAQAQSDLSLMYFNVGKVQLLHSGQLDHALVSFERSHRIREKLAKEHPDNAEAQRGLMVAYLSLGDVHRALANYSMATEKYEAAAQVLRKMIDQGMIVEDSKDRLAVVEQAAASAKRMEIALGEWEVLLVQPSDSLPALLEARCYELAKRSRFSEATQAAAKLKSLENADGGQLYNAACVFSLCAAAIKAPDGEELSAESVAERERRIADALATLKHAVDAGFDDFAHIQKDPDLAILRERPELKALLAQLAPSDSQ